jgi:hypothetical protein
MGVAGSGYNGLSANNSLGTVLYPNDGYLYTQGDTAGGNLVLGSNQAGGVVRIIANGASALADTVATFAANGVTVAANVSANYYIGNGSLLTGLYANANLVTYLASNANVVITTTGNITTTANISGAFIKGNGSQLTGMYGNTQVAAYLPVNTSNVAGNNFTVSGNVTAGSFGGQKQLLGYTATATTVTFNIPADFPQTFDVGQTIYVSGILTGPTELNGYWLVTAATLSTVTIACTLQPTDPFVDIIIAQVVNIRNISATGNISGQYIIGDGGQLTNITGANVTGTVASATVAASANSVAGANVSGEVAFAAVANSVAVANVSGIGNIAVLNIDGDSANILYGNGVFAPVPSSYGNSNVSTYLASGTNTGGFSSAGNITLGGTGSPVTLQEFSSTPTEVTLGWSPSISPAPFSTGDTVLVDGGSGVDGSWTVVSCDTNGVTIDCDLNPGSGFYTDLPGPTVSLVYISSVTASGDISGVNFIATGGISAGGTIV